MDVCSIYKSSLYSGGFLGLESSVEEQIHMLTSDWQILAAVLWTGLVTTALTSYGENFAMKSLSSAETTVIFSTEPLWGTAFAALYFGEHIGPNTFIGAFSSSWLVSGLRAKG